MKITLDKVVAGAEGSLGGRDPGLSGIPAFEGCSLDKYFDLGPFTKNYLEIYYS